MITRKRSAPRITLVVLAVLAQLMGTVGSAYAGKGDHNSVPDRLYCEPQTTGACGWLLLPYFYAKPTEDYVDASSYAGTDPFEILGVIDGARVKIHAQIHHLLPFPHWNTFDSKVRPTSGWANDVEEGELEAYLGFVCNQPNRFKFYSRHWGAQVEFQEVVEGSVFKCANADGVAQEIMDQL